jgi:hypothetical protein
MKPSLKLFAGPVLVVLILGGAIYGWHRSHRPIPVPTPPQSSVVNIADFDDFQSKLAQRVYKQLGVTDADSDFSVIVAPTAYPVGTLLRADESVPADFSDCVPAAPPASFPAEHLFPAYSLSSETALAANLGSDALQGLDSAGANFKHSSSIRYTIENAQIQIMDDKSVEMVTSNGGCGSYIAAHPGTRLVRGAVTGKMTFAVQVDNPASVKAQFAKVGGFSVDDDPQASTLNISDGQNQPIVELLSEFHSKPAPTSAEATPATKKLPALMVKKTAPVVATQVVQPTPVGKGAASAVGTQSHAQTRIDVQQDSKDAPGAGAKVIRSLHAAWPDATVVPNVKRVPSARMPPTPQVRYFNKEDAGLAARCLEIFKQAYPNAKVVRIGLPVQQGQLEVWLPRVGSTPHP